MLKERANEWTTALRSEEFAQGDGVLVDGRGRHCCLGVLSVLAERAGVVTRDRDGIAGPVRFTSVTDTEDSSTAILPIAVMQWAGMLSTLGIYGNENDDHSLAADNDRGATFAELADFIERNYESL